MVRYSRHARGRMRLYGLTEKDVELVIECGKKQITASGKLTYLGQVNERFTHPVKVACVEEADAILAVTAYPLRKGRFQNEGDVRQDR
jgi:hypothetical protein